MEVEGSAPKVIILCEMFKNDACKFVWSEQVYIVTKLHII